jgi:hypothetical protein
MFIWLNKMEHYESPHLLNSPFSARRFRLHFLSVFNSMFYLISFICSKKPLVSCQDTITLQGAFLLLEKYGKPY